MKKRHMFILSVLLTGCNSETETRYVTESPEPVIPTNPPKPTIPDIPLIPLEPSIPILPPEPILPVFIGEGISTHTQQPYKGTVTRGGDDYLRYNTGVIDFQDFTLPAWCVDYKYEPFLEVLITNGSDTLCTRYSFKLDGFGYARPNCLWSDTRNDIKIDDMKNAYYGYSIVETRIWINGVVGLIVGVE